MRMTKPENSLLAFIQQRNSQRKSYNEHFDSANDAIEALEKLATDAYDVLLLDINMLHLSGTALVGQLRERNPPLPSIVFVTAHVEHTVAAFQRHTVDYVLKPFSSKRINEALDRASRRAKGELGRKIDRNHAAVAEAVSSWSPDDRNQR
jgi:DNA-binding LytR/AlgR family response regulator